MTLYRLDEELPAEIADEKDNAIPADDTNDDGTADVDLDDQEEDEA